MHFADRLMRVCRERDSRLVVGLDPHQHLIPASFKQGYAADDHENIIVDYLSEVIRVCAPSAAAFKPQIAFFEQFGLAGIKAFSRILEVLHRHDAIVITDGKRNDIGSTAAAYAAAYFGNDRLAAAFPSHGLTVNGYLGGDGIQPFLDNPEHGIFVLVKSSNPSSGDLQDLRLADGSTVAETMAGMVDRWNQASLGESGYGNVGAVVGATWPDHMARLRGLMPHSLILVPGYGAQGGDEAAVRAAFNADGLGALINSSRGIIFPSGFAERGFDAVAEACRTAREHINSLIS